MSSDTIFGKIIRGEVPAQKVFEDDDLIVLRDIQPVAPHHLLVIPRKPIVNAADASPQDAELLGKLILRAAQVARDEGFADSGFRLVLNVNADGGQSVDHLHLHVIGGRRMTWPPG